MKWFSVRLNGRLTGWEGGREREWDIQEGKRWKKVKERARSVSRLRSAEEKGTASTFPENKKQLVKRFLKHFWIRESPFFFRLRAKFSQVYICFRKKNFILSADESTRGLKQFVFERIGFQCEEVSEKMEWSWKRCEHVLVKREWILIQPIWVKWIERSCTCWPDQQCSSRRRLRPREPGGARGLAQSEMVRETRHLWIGNLPDNVREERIVEHFQR